MLYFAYGSNLDCQQMRSRCPPVQFVCRAALRGYDFGFTRLSTRRQCGVMDIVKSEGKKVWGVVYRIADPDVSSLDNAEGYNPSKTKNAYIRLECTVYEEDDSEKPLLVQTYEVQDKSPEYIPPDQAYKSQIVYGARFWNLPADYIHQLDIIRTAN